MKDYQKWLPAYLSVSDDKGEFLGDVDLESEVKKLCEDLVQEDLGLEEDPEMWVDRIKDLTIRYSIPIISRYSRIVVRWRCHRKFDRDFAFDLQK